MRRTLILFVSSLLLFVSTTVADSLWATRDTSVKQGPREIKTVKKGEQLQPTIKNGRIVVSGKWTGVNVMLNGRRTTGWVASDAVSTTRPAQPKVTETPEDFRPVWDQSAQRAQTAPGLHPYNAAINGAMVLVRMKSLDSVVKGFRDLAMQVQPAITPMISLETLLSALPPEPRRIIRAGLITDKPVALIVYPSDASLRGEPEACAIIPVRNGRQIETLVAQLAMPRAVAKVDGNHLFIGKSAVIFERITRDFGAIGDIPAADFAGQIQVSVCIPNIKHLLIWEIEKELEKARVLAGKSEDPEDIVDLRMQQLVASICLTLADEILQSNVELGFEESGLRIVHSLVALPQSKTANTISEIGKSPGEDLTGRVPSEDAVFLGNLNISGEAFGKLAKSFIHDAFVIARESGAIPTDQERTFNEVQTAVTGVIDAWTGNLSISGLPSSLGGAAVISAGSNGQLGASLGALKNALNKVEPIQQEQRTRSFKGVSVDSFVETAGDNAGVIVFETAHTPKVSMAAMGKSIQWATDAAIDASRGKGKIPQAIQQLNASLSTKPQGTFSLKLTKFLAQLEREEGSDEMSELAAQLALDEPPIFGIMNIHEDRVVTQLFVSVTSMRNMQAYVVAKSKAKAEE